MKTLYLILPLLLCQTTISRAGAPTYRPKVTQNISYKTEATDCNLPTSQFVMDVNNVRATLLTAGDMWYDINTSSAGYEVPKGDHSSGGSFPNAIYTGSIWVSALDQGNNLKTAALTYRQNGGSDYFSGPLDNTGAVTQSTCNLWDRHFPVWATQIRGVINAYALQGNTGTLPLSSISDSIKYWPGKGNPFLSALGYDVSQVLAPFFDADGDGIYDPTHGDYPTLKQGGLNASSQASSCGHALYDSLAYSNHSYYADEMVFWVMNDKGGPHAGSTNGQPIGLQVNSLAFAFISSDWVNSMTFYRYQLVNKSGAVLNQSYVSQYTDVDLGCPNNDRVGCDTSLKLAFAYNGVPQGGNFTPGYNYTCDQGIYCISGVTGYNCKLPMLGIMMLETPADTSANGPRQVGMTSFMSYQNSGSAVGDPANALEYRNYQRGIWKDGTPLTYGGNGYQNSAIRTSYMFPGDPSLANQWSECNPQIGAPIGAGDRRMLQSAGPFTFMPCASQFLELAVIFVDSVNSNCPSLSAFHDHLNIPTAVADIPSVNTAIKVYPNPVSSELILESSNGTRINATEVYDLTGRLVSKQTGDKRSIDMSTLPEGIYMVKVYTRAGMTVTKVAKK